MVIGEWCFRPATARAQLPLRQRVTGVTKVTRVAERDTESVAVCQTFLVKIKTRLELHVVSLVFGSGFNPTRGTKV